LFAFDPKRGAGRCAVARLTGAAGSARRAARQPLASESRVLYQVQQFELIQNMKLSQTSAVKSLDRGLDILEYVAGCSEPPSFSQLLGNLGIPRSSLFHLLTNLLSRNFLERDPKTERYRVGAEIAEIARKVQRPSLSDRITPFLRQLSLEISETCGFYVRVSDAVEVVASAISTQALTYTMKVGMKAPLYAVSAGKIVLSELPSQELGQYLARVAFAPVTPQTIRSKTRLKKEIQKVKATDFAYSREEFTLGITAIATAVRSETKFFGAINLAVPTARFTPDRDADFREALRRAAQLIAREINREQ
jgi:IclR family transcriptional regulator, acetate operon repressor